MFFSLLCIQNRNYKPQLKTVNSEAVYLDAVDCINVWSCHSPPAISPLPIVTMNDSRTMNVSPHHVFYFIDGDLVIQSSPNSEGTVTMFWMNKSVLAFNSPVFSDMFGLPSGSARDLYDVLPMVHAADTEEEWSALFSALYDPK